MQGELICARWLLAFPWFPRGSRPPRGRCAGTCAQMRPRKLESPFWEPRATQVCGEGEADRGATVRARLPRRGPMAAQCPPRELVYATKCPLMGMDWALLDRRGGICRVLPLGVWADRGACDPRWAAAAIQKACTTRLRTAVRVLGNITRQSRRGQPSKTQSSQYPPQRRTRAHSPDICSVQVRFFAKHFQLVSLTPAGAEVVRLLALHPHMRITAMTGDSQAGKDFSEVFPHLVSAS